MKRVLQPYTFVAGARAAACGLVALVLWRAGALHWPVQGTSFLLLVYSVVYTACAMWLLRRWLARVRDGSLLLFYDLLLSAVPLWLGGGWRSPFLPVALGALVVPAVSLRWRNGLLAAAAFSVIDQAILWSTTPTPWQLTQQGQAVPLLARTLAPYALVLIITSVVRIGQRMRRRAEQRRRQAAQRRTTPLPPVRQNIPPVGIRAGSYGRSGTSGATTQTLSTVAAQRPQTLRRACPDVPTMLRRLGTELDAAGVACQVQLVGDERQMPPAVRALVLQALEVSIDNVLAHAHAKHVAITLQVEGHAARLQVLDDGDGLWDGTAEPPGFHQVKRLRYRVQEAGGALQVAEVPDGGVLVAMHVPFR